MGASRRDMGVAVRRGLGAVNAALQSAWPWSGAPGHGFFWRVAAWLALSLPIAKAAEPDAPDQPLDERADGAIEAQEAETSPAKASAAPSAASADPAADPATDPATDLAADFAEPEPAADDEASDEPNEDAPLETARGRVPAASREGVAPLADWRDAAASDAGARAPKGETAFATPDRAVSAEISLASAPVAARVAAPEPIEIELGAAPLAPPALRYDPATIVAVDPEPSAADIAAYAERADKVPTPPAPVGDAPPPISDASPAEIISETDQAPIVIPVRGLHAPIVDPVPLGGAGAAAPGAAASEVIDGTPQNDVVTGGDENDVLTGFAGADEIRGGAGDDTLNGELPVGQSTESLAAVVTNETIGADTAGEPVAISLDLPGLVDDPSVVATGVVSTGDASSDLNIAYVIDVSGSTSAFFSGVETVGDRNGDGVENTVLDAEIAGFETLTSELIAGGLAGADVALIAFTGSAVTRITTTLGADANGNAQVDIIDTLQSLRSGGGTSFGPALQESIAFFQGAGSGDNVVFFLSDGRASGGFGQQLAELTDPNGLDASIRAVGVGLGADLNQLNQLDNTVNADGTVGAELVTAPSQLTSALTAAGFNRDDIDRIDISVNGVLQDSIPGSALITSALGLQYQTLLTGLDPAPGAESVIEATLVLVDGTSLDVTGETTIAAFDDVLAGGAGDDRIDGGPGFDTAEFAAPRAEFNILTDASTGVTTVEHQLGDQSEGTDTLTRVERLVFSDGVVVDLPTLNIAPNVAAPTQAVVGVVGAAIAVSGLTVGDVDTPLLDVTLTPTNGAVAVAAVAGVSQTAQADGSVLLRGAPDALNTALATTTFVAENAAARLTLAVDDGQFTDSAEVDFTLTASADAPPVNETPAEAVAVAIGRASAVVGLSVEDADSQTVATTLTPTSGALSIAAPGAAVVTALPLGALQIEGSLTEVNAALNGLSITTTEAGPASIAMRTTDGVLTDVDVIALEAVDRPLIVENRPIFGFQGQNDGGFTVSEGGSAITLTGDSWHAIDLGQVIDFDANTVLRLEISTDVAPEILAVGFDENGVYDGDDCFSTFQLAGTQEFGLQCERGTVTPGAGFVSVEIALADACAGPAQFLTLVHDNDVSQAGSATFRNISFVNVGADDDTIFITASGGGEGSTATDLLI